MNIKHIPYIVVTRPEPGLSETIYDLQQLGWNTIKSPLMEINFLPFNLPSPIDIQAILLTSRQAVKSLKEQCYYQLIDYRHIPVFAVGDITANDAKHAGFTKVFSAHKDAIALSHLIQQTLSPQKGALFFPAGKGQGDVLVKLLEQSYYKIIRKFVYETVSVTKFPDTFLQAFIAKQIKTILFFSSETSRFFMQLLNENWQYLCSTIQVIAISEKTAKPLQSIQWKEINIANLPNTKEMLSFLKKTSLEN